MHTNYRNYQIDISATERRDGSVATEACIAVNYQPLHSIFVFLGQDALALEKAQRWIDEREGVVSMTAPVGAAVKTITPETDRTNPRRPKTEYRAELDGDLVGYYRNYFDAEKAIDKLALERIVCERVMVRLARLDPAGEPPDIPNDDGYPPLPNV